MTVVMGDLNAKVGQEQDPLREVVGRHGLGSRNEQANLKGEVLKQRILSRNWVHQRRERTVTISLLNNSPL